MTKKLPAWSFSGLKSFLGCGLKYYHLKVAKTYTEPPTEATLYGTEFHLACEEYVRDGKPLPGRFEYFKDTLDALIAKPGEKVCEKKLALNADLQPCDFFAPDCWFRGIADLLILNHDKGTAFVVDYKTGKSSQYADKGQLELMALAVFAHYPHIKKVNAGLLFVVPKQLIPATYTVENIPELWRKWLADYSKLEKAHETGVWNASPSGLCRRHCVVLDCPHNGRN
jgi:hypothetical protein